MKRSKFILPRLPRRLAESLALLAGLVYLAQSWVYIHSQASVLDEGLYLYKGALFASGRYTPFQDFGPWTNHMPLAYLIPGYVQVWFGEGLRTGRVFAVALGLLMLPGLWFTGKHLGGKWWGLALVGAVAANPALVKIYSVSASQGLIACLLALTLALTLGEGRKPWQLVLGAALAGAIPLTRINLTPVWPFVVGYIYWQHGKRAGNQAAAVSLLVFAGLHALYWPGILRMWAPYLPQSLTPFLAPFRRPPGITAPWNPSMPPLRRALSLLLGLRFHLLAVLGLAGLALFAPPRAAWRSLAAYRAAIFSAGLFAVLFALHAWAALGGSYCVFCFPAYLSFFSSLGLAALAASFASWRTLEPSARQRLVAPLLLALAAGIGLSAFDTFGPAILPTPTVRQLLDTQIPRTSGSGTIELWGFLGNYLHLGYDQVVQQAQYYGRMAATTLLGLLLGILTLTAARTRRLFRLETGERPFAARAMLLALALGMALTPTAALGGGYRTYDCPGGDVLAAYEAAGRHLQATLPPGVPIYWQTELSPAVLLALPGLEIFPAQLNGQYSFRTGGEPQALARLGLWNQALAEQWAAEAGAFILSGASFEDPSQAWLVDMVQSPAFDELASTEPLHPCQRDSRLYIFVRRGRGEVDR